MKKKKIFAPTCGPADGAAKLVEPKRGFLSNNVIEEVGGVQRVIAEILEERAVKSIAPGLCHDADLPAGAGAKFCRKVIGIDTKLLDVLQTRLQTKWRGHFPV